MGKLPLPALVFCLLTSMPHFIRAEEFPDSRHYPGLTNYGNTCFLNGALKLLGADSSFVDTLLQSSIDHHYASPRLVAVRERLKQHLIAFMRHLHGGERTANKPHYQRLTNKLLRGIIRDYRIAYLLHYHRQSPAIPGEQQDPQEIIQHLLELASSHKRPSASHRDENSLLIADTLQWSTEGEARITSLSANTFLSVPAQLSNGHLITSMQEAVDAYFAPETVQGTKEINFATGTKKLILRNSPKTLLVQLNRFSFDIRTSHSRRLSHEIQHGPLVIPIYDETGKAVEKAYYRLRAVEVHRPFNPRSIDEGHYYTYIRGENTWICHNDAQTPFEADDADQDIARNGYIFSYTLVTTEPYTSPVPTYGTFAR